MGKMKVLPVRELFKLNPEKIRDGLKNDLDILFEDDIILHMSYKEIILQRFIMEIYNNLPQIKITSKHAVSNYYTNGILTSKTINKVMENILENIVNVYVKPSNDRSILNNVYYNMQQLYSYIYNKLTYQKQEYCNSININDLLAIQMESELLNSIKEVNKEKNIQSVNKAYDILDKIIRTKEEFRNNVVAKGYISGSINPNQVKQLLAPRGYITEINSAIFKTPVASSFTLGMSSIYDLAIESRSGAKALETSTSAIKESEYFARELQLTTMIVERLADGDCGTKNYLNWYVRPEDENTKADLINLVGKYYLNEETGVEEPITIKHKHLEGKTIKLRSVLNCELEDKNAVCSKCFGELTYGIPKHFNLGHYCSTVMTQKLSQSILSTKHLMTSASTGSIKLDETGSKIFNIKSNSYYFKKDILKPSLDWELIISQYEAFGIKDLRPDIDVYKLNPARVSSIKSIILVSTNKKTGEVKTYPVIIKDINKFGNFSYSFIKYIIATGVSVNDNGEYVINLNNFDYKEPFIVMPEVEYNFAALVSSIRSKFRGIQVTKSNESYETPESFVQIIFDLVNSKLDVNLALLEVMVYAHTVSSVNNNDYSLGRNSPDRQLVKSNTLIPRRSLGAAYGWERVLDNVILNPRCYYGYNNVDHPMDIIIKPSKSLRK